MDGPSSSSNASILITCTQAFELEAPASDSSPILDKAAADWQPECRMSNSHYDSFLAFRPSGDAEMTVRAPGNQSFTFKSLSLDYIQDVCPLLGYSFEERAHGKKFLSIIASSIELVARFLRYIYTSSYLVIDHTGEELPCTFLMHAQLYHYAELYDLPGLMDAAYLHVNMISELGCSMPYAPVGLCDTLRYLYQNVKGERKVHEVILHYCISRFITHGLGEDPEFRSLLIEAKECQQDLFRLIRQRGFNDESSSSIIQMPLPGEPRKPNLQYDYVYEMFCTSTFSTPAQTPDLSGLSTPAGFTLVHRPRHIGDMPGTADSEGYSSDGSLLSDFENFSLISRACASIESAAQEKSSQRSQTLDNKRIAVGHDDTGEGLFDSENFRSGAFDSLEDDPFADPSSPYLSDVSAENLYEDENEADWSDFDDDFGADNGIKSAVAGGHDVYNLDDAACSTETIVAASNALPHLGQTSSEIGPEDPATKGWEVPEASEVDTAGKGSTDPRPDASVR